jgi:ubiquitin C-terminal hydrolase
MTAHLHRNNQQQYSRRTLLMVSSSSTQQQYHNQNQPPEGAVTVDCWRQAPADCWSIIGDSNDLMDIDSILPPVFPAANNVDDNNNEQQQNAVTKKVPFPLCGLHNLGNTCYMNRFDVVRQKISTNNL